jgi:hypothetical protein
MFIKYDSKDYEDQKRMNEGFLEKLVSCPDRCMVLQQGMTCSCSVCDPGAAFVK